MNLKFLFKLINLILLLILIKSLKFKIFMYILDCYKILFNFIIFQNYNYLYININRKYDFYILNFGIYLYFFLIFIQQNILKFFFIINFYRINLLKIFKSQLAMAISFFDIKNYIILVYIIKINFIINYV